MLKQLSVGMMCAAAPLAGAAWAESTADEGVSQSLSEIVVTAQKRESTVQDTPISISAVTGADIQARGITDLATLVAITPGVSVKNNGPGQTELERRQFPDRRFLSR